MPYVAIAVADSASVLDETDVAVPVRQEHREERSDLGVRRVGVDHRHRRVGNVGNSLLLHPEGRARQVVCHRIPVVGWREDCECRRVGESGGDSNSEHAENRVAERAACPVEAFAKRTPRRSVPRPQPEPSCNENDSESGEDRPVQDAAGDRDEERDCNDLGEAEEVRGEHEPGDGRRGELPRDEPGRGHHHAEPGNERKGGHECGRA